MSVSAELHCDCKWRMSSGVSGRVRLSLYTQLGLVTLPASQCGHLCLITGAKCYRTLILSLQSTPHWGNLQRKLDLGSWQVCWDNPVSGTDLQSHLSDIPDQISTRQPTREKISAVNRLNREQRIRPTLGSVSNIFILETCPNARRMCRRCVRFTFKFPNQDEQF